MKTTIINHRQGSPAWHAHRAGSFNASELAAAMGLPAHITRTELIALKATRITGEVDKFTQKLFDDGHEYEALARPWAEEIFGEELYPCVMAADVEGLSRPISASFDGITISGNAAWEHKSLNAELAASLDVGVIPDEYHPQMEQGMLLGNVQRFLFMASRGDRESMRHAWYDSNPVLRDQIIPTWMQIDKDTADYSPTEVIVKPAANAVTALPAVSVQVSGAIAIRENFPAFEVALRDFIDHRLIRNPETDQDFADLELQIKALKTAELALDAAEAQMLSQVESVDAAKRMKDMLHKMTRDNRLMAEKLMSARKDSIRAEIVMSAGKELWKHCNGLNERIGRRLLPNQTADFAGAIKGKRTIESLTNAVNTELARAKIEANAMADRITINLRAINEKPELAFLFADFAQLVLKAPDDLAAVVQNRISAHQANEAARIEAERARIAAEERAKAEAAERARADAEIAAATAKARVEAHAQAQADAQARRASDEAIAKAKSELATPETVAIKLVEQPLFSSEESSEQTPTLNLGQICTLLGFTVSAEFLRHFGFEPAYTNKNAMLYHAQDFPRICHALSRHVLKVGQGVAQA